MTTTNDLSAGPLGSVLRQGDDVRLHFTREFDATPPEVWDALTDPERTARWIGSWSGDPASGSVQFTMTGAPDAFSTVSIETCEPPRRLELTMASLDGPWPLTVTLTERAGGTVLEFTHHLVEPYDASGVGPGWHYFLDRLHAVLAGTELPSDMAPYSSLADRYPIPSA